MDEDHALAADIGQVDEHQRTSLDSAQPGRIAREPRAVQEYHRFAYGQFLSYFDLKNSRGGL